MRHMQWQLKRNWDQAQSPNKIIHPSKKVQSDLEWWCTEENVMKGVPLGTPAPATLLYTDASLEGWGLTPNVIRYRGFGQ